jgi:hypothetical protein
MYVKFLSFLKQFLMYFLDLVKMVGTSSVFGWLVADGWCWFVLREEYCWLVAGGWFILREKYCWLVADKPSEQAAGLSDKYFLCLS